MKKLLYLFLLIGLSSCEFYYLEPVYRQRDRIVGHHDIEEYSATYNDYTNYSIYVEAGRYSDQIYINNFYGIDISVLATISGDKINISRQVVDGYEIEGVGTIYGNDISLSYSVKDVYSGTRTDFCEANSL